MWRRPLERYSEDEEADFTCGSELLRFLAYTYVEGVDLLCVDAGETTEVFRVSLSTIGDAVGYVGCEASGEVISTLEAGVTALRVRIVMEKLRSCMEDLQGESLVGRQSLSGGFAGITAWNVLKELDDVSCLELRQFVGWWQQYVVCDIRIMGKKISLRPLDLLLRLECLATDTKWDGGSLGISVKQTQLLRSLLLRLAQGMANEGSEIRRVLEVVLDCLGKKKVEEAQEAWRQCQTKRAEVLVVAGQLYPQFSKLGRLVASVDDSEVLISQSLVPPDRFLVIILDQEEEADMSVVLPGMQVRQLLLAMQRQVSLSVALECIYGIRSSISRHKYWGMPRGCRLSWKDDLALLSSVIVSRQEAIRHAILYDFEHRPIWMVLGVAPSVEMMTRLCYDDGSSFKEKEITSVRCRDSLRTLLASPRAAVVSFSRVDTDYPLGIVGVYGRRSLDSLAKDPRSVVSELIRKAEGGQAIELITVDHYSTPAEYATKTLRATFTMLQWLCERNVVSTETTIEFKNLQASDLVESFKVLIGKDFVVTQLPIERSPWVAVSVKYVEWLRKRGVRVELDSVDKQYADSVPGQGILRLRWQGKGVPTLAVQDTDLTINMMSEMGLVRFGRCASEEADRYVILDQGVIATLTREVALLCKGNVSVDAFMYQDGKFNVKRWASRVYPVNVGNMGAELSRMTVPDCFRSIQESVQYRVVIRASRKGACSLCEALAGKFGWSREAAETLPKVIQVLQNGIPQACDVPWKARSALEVELAAAQRSLETDLESRTKSRSSLWQEYGNLRLFENDEQVGREFYDDQMVVVRETVRIGIDSALSGSCTVLMAIRVDEESVLLLEEWRATDPIWTRDGVVICVISRKGERNEYQLIDGTAAVLAKVSRCMMECAHTLLETMISALTWKDHMLAWYHTEWMVRVQWSTVPLRVVGVADICCTVSRRGSGALLTGKAAQRSRGKPPHIHEGRAMEELNAMPTPVLDCSSTSHIVRLGHTETVVSQYVVVSGFHSSCLAEEVSKQIVNICRLIQLPIEEGQVLSHLKRDQYGESSTGLRMVIIPLKAKVTFSTRPELGPPFFFSLLSDAITVRYGPKVRPERFLLMVSPCPGWLNDIRQPSFISRGYTGMDVSDMMLLNSMGWALRKRFPTDIGEMAFVRVQIRMGFLVSVPGSKASPIMRYAQETIVIHFTQRGVRQMSPWSWLEQQSGWSKESIRLIKDGTSSKILIREEGGRFDIWKAVKTILEAGYEHIMASSDVVGTRDVTYMSCRNTALPTNLTFPLMLKHWEEREVDLASVACIMWASPRLEAVKGRKRFGSRGAHICVLWNETRVEIDIHVPELPLTQLDVEVSECLEGMWRSSIGLDGIFISLIPGNIRNYFMMQGQTVMPPRSKAVSDLLLAGWGRTSSVAVNHTPEMGRLVAKSPMRSSLKRSVSYADMVENTGGEGREEVSSTTQESGSGQDSRDDSTLTSGGDDKIWQEISKIRSELMTLQQAGGGDQVITRLEERMQQVELLTVSLQAQQDNTTSVLEKVQADGVKVSQAVSRIEDRIDNNTDSLRDIKELLMKQQVPSVPQGWMQTAAMMELYRTQLQLEARMGQTGTTQRLHDGVRDTNGASNELNNG